MPRSPSRPRRAVAAVIGLVMVASLAAVALAPRSASAWGTLTGGAGLSFLDEQKLQWILSNYGVTPLDAADFTARLGAHPIHQYIVYEASLLLARDPASSDGLAGFPDAATINATDGIDIVDGLPQARASRGLATDPAWAPVVPDASTGVSPDALRTASTWNPDYEVMAHSWNPWLATGDAPRAAARRFTRLMARLIIAPGAPGPQPMTTRGPAFSSPAASEAAYLAHYLADVVSPKHADAIPLDTSDLDTLEAHANTLFAELDARPPLATWLQSPSLSAAVAVITQRAKALGPRADAWLARLDRHLPLIAGTTLLRRVSDSQMTLVASDLRTATACFLAGLRARPRDEPRDSHYGYFDPFYFNGPIYERNAGAPGFELCSPLSEHMQWETQPGQSRVALQALTAQASTPPDKRLPRLSGPTRGHYQPWSLGPAATSPDATVAAQAYRDAMSQLVRTCSEKSHGDIDTDSDFDADLDRPIDLAIACVFTAFRASVTALRAEAWGRRATADVVSLEVRVRNLADADAHLASARVGYIDTATGQRVSRPGWLTPLGDATVVASNAAPTLFRVDVADVPADLPLTSLFVDLRATVDDTPDRGWLRVTPSEIGTTVVENPALGALDTPTDVPTDVIVVFDTTGSMQSSIDALRKDAVAAIAALRKRTSDLRLAIVTFRDLAEVSDKGHFLVRPFSADLGAQFAFLDTLTADGGGDTAEDQLEGLSRALELWEREPSSDRVPAKIIVVITDAPGKDPDVRGRNIAQIAKRAHDVDPAHIYPIVVGDDPQALSFASSVAASTQGRVTRAAQGADVARVLREAVALAITAHADEARTGPADPLSSLFIALAIALATAALVLAAASFISAREAAPRSPPSSEGARDAR